MKYKLTIYDNDGSITYESSNADEIIKQLESAKVYKLEQKKEIGQKKYIRRLTPYECCRNEVYATGNKWAIENFHATH